MQGIRRRSNNGSPGAGAKNRPSRLSRRRCSGRRAEARTLTGVVAAAQALQAAERLTAVGGAMVMRKAAKTASPGPPFELQETLLSPCAAGGGAVVDALSGRVANTTRLPITVE